MMLSSGGVDSSSMSPDLKMKMDDEKYLGSVLQSIKRRNGSSFAGSVQQSTAVHCSADN